MLVWYCAVPVCHAWHTVPMGQQMRLGFTPVIQQQQGIQHKTFLCPGHAECVTYGWVLGWFLSTSSEANPSAGWSLAWNCWVGCCGILGAFCSGFCSRCLAVVTAALLARALRRALSSLQPRNNVTKIALNFYKIYRFYRIWKPPFISCSFQTSYF